MRQIHESLAEDLYISFVLKLTIESQIETTNEVNEMVGENMRRKMIDDSALFELLGKSQNMKLLEYFLETEGEELLFFSDIAEATKVRRDSIRPLLDRYSQIGVIKVVTKRKRNLYQFNKSNQYSRLLMQIYKKVLKDRKNFS
jgi:hypothetical protein